MECGKQIYRFTFAFLGYIYYQLQGGGIAYSLLPVNSRKYREQKPVCHLQGAFHFKIYYQFGPLC